MKSEWLEKYDRVQENPPVLSDAVTGFNANIDVITDAEKLSLESKRAESHKEISNQREMLEEVADAVEKCENREKTLLSDIEIDGEEKIGGQGGIASNFLAKHGSGVVFYTPFLSEELAEMVDEHVLFPVVEGQFALKNVRDASNTDRTKKNIIVEYSGDCSGRVIFSRRMQGFGPYFRKGVEDSFDELEEGMDCAFLSGFHDTEGNVEAKFRKCKKQLEGLDLPIHLEYVHSENICEILLEEILPAVESMGMDEEEALRISEQLDIETDDELTLGEAFKLSKRLIKQFGVQRVHLHTYRYHVSVSEGVKEPKKVRESMLFGELAALAAADSGQIPGREELARMNFEEIHLHRTDEMDHFEDFFELEKFSSTGSGTVDGLQVVAIPTLIHEDPERLVGMGDIISSGTWAALNS